jgi:pimeloyl-ACP methyl ester carboxylesterase
MTSASSERPVICVLIHGTWARGAKWTQEDSELWQSLSELKVDPENVIRFSWTGKNSSAARLRAATQLAAELQSSMEKRPTAAHYLIAHSHGGMVALYALRDQDLSRRIAGVVFLGTPFIRCRPRWLRLFTSSLSLAFLCTAILIPCSELFLISVRGSLTHHDVVGGNSLLRCFPWISTGALTFLGMIWAVAIARDPIIAILRKQQAKAAHMHDLTFPSRLDTPVLCIRVIGDEARLWLSALVLQFETLAWVVMGAVIAMIIVALLFVAHLIGTAYYDVYLFQTDVEFRAGPGDLTSMAFTLMWVALWDCGVLLVATILLLVGHRLLRAGGWAFGESGMLSNLLFKLSVERAPIGAGQCDKKSYWWLRGTLGHCVLYRDKRVLAALVHWIRDIEANYAGLRTK